MTFLQSTFLGVRIWILFYLGLSVIMFGGVMIYFFREKLRKKYYEIRFPEKLLKVVIHYKSGMFKEYWRLVPDLEYFVIEKKQYQFDSKHILKENDFFLRGIPPKQIVKIEGKEYQFDNLFQLKNRWTKYPEVHYFYNSPMPLSFDMSKGKIEFSSQQLEEFKQNDLFRKLLTLDTEKSFLTFILLLNIINLMASGFIIARLMEWI